MSLETEEYTGAGPDFRRREVALMLQQNRNAV
jgi:hypothetical protein